MLDKADDEIVKGSFRGRQAMGKAGLIADFRIGIHFENIRPSVVPDAEIDTGIIPASQESVSLHGQGGEGLT